MLLVVPSTAGGGGGGGGGGLVPPVANSDLADMAANTLKGNATAGATSPQDIALSTNEFLARSSASNIEAKIISDFALGLLTDADAASMRTTLGVASGFWGDDGFGNIQPVLSFAGAVVQPRTDGGESLGTAALQWSNVETQQLNGTTLTAAGLALLDDANAAAQRTTLGSTVTGDALFTAATPAAGRTTLDSGAVGDNLFTAATALAAQQAMDTEVGVDVQAYDATLASISSLGTVANRTIYTTAVDTWAETPLTAFARTILDDADAGDVRTTLGSGVVGDNLFTAATAAAAQQAMDTEVGVDVQAYDATLQSLSALGTAANRVAYTTGVDTWAETPLTAFARTILDDADASAVKTTLSIFEGWEDSGGNLRPVAAYATDAVVPRTDGAEDLGTGALQWGDVQTKALNGTSLTAQGLALLDDATASAQRTTLGATVTGDALFTAANAGGARTTLGSEAVGDNLFTASTALAAQQAMDVEVGVDVQAYDALLNSIAGLSVSANKMLYFTAVDTATVTDLSAFARTILDDADASAVRTTISAASTTHQATHNDGGSDALKLDDLATPDDNTDLDATTGRHGLLPKLGGGTTNFLRADGTWAAPSGGGGGTVLWEDSGGNLRPVAAYTGDAVVPRTDGAEDLGTAALQWGDVQTKALNGATLTASGLALLDDASASAQRTTLGAGAVGDDLFTAANASAAQQAMDVEVGVDVQAYDATLNSIAGQGTASDKYLYTTGVDTWTEGSITSLGRSILDDATAGDVRTTISAASTTHQSTHNSGGSDALKLDDLDTPDDNTDLDATTGRHGLLPKLGGGTTNFLRADGTWAAPSGGGGTVLWEDSGGNLRPVAAYTGDAVVPRSDGGEDLGTGALQWGDVQTKALSGTTLTAAGLALLDDADAAAQRTTLGLGSWALKNAEYVSIDNTDSPYSNIAGNDGKIVLCDDSSGAITVNLQAASTAGGGYTVGFLKTSSSNYVLIDANGAETIGGRTTGRLVSQYDFVLLRSDGSNWQIIGANYQRRTVSFTSTGANTFTTVNEVPLGCLAVKARVLGAGGSGGSSNHGGADSGGGGSGGGYSEETIPTSSLSATETATVGAGGAAISANTDTAGNDGGTSSFGAFCSATGGSGGIAGTSASGEGLPNAGGSGSGGDLNLGGSVGIISQNGWGTVRGYGGASALGNNASCFGLASGKGSGGSPGNEDNASEAGGDGVILVEIL